MKIGVIGAGLIGGAVARRASAAGHEVMIANSRGPETLDDLARQIGARAVWAREAASAEDIVVLSVLPGVIASLSPEFFAATPAGAAIVDTSNYYPRTRDGIIPEIEGGMLESEWVASRIGRPVVKAFNMLKASSLAGDGTPPGTPNRIAIGLAGDDAQHRARVAQLIDQIGFDAVDVGPLCESWRLHPGTLGYCHNYDAITLRAALAATKKPLIGHYRREADDFATELVKLFGSVDAVGAARTGG
jgi:8-hydroxy-5-deazaflavin:NADPH oxidoreductase